jgi:hypothetical protein
MSEELRKSLFNEAPYDGTSGSSRAPVADDYGVILFSGGQLGTETDSVATVVPEHWHGLEVGMLALGGVAHVGFSKRSAAVMDRPAVASNAGVVSQVGCPIPAGTEKRFRVPKVSPGERVYFVRESDTVGTTVRMRVLS